MRKIIILLLSIVLIISLTACGQDDFERFIEATKKTDAIKRGQEEIVTVLEFDFNIEGLSDEEIKALNYLKKIKSKFYITFDCESNKIISRSYYNFSGLGFDSEFYMNEGKSFIKVPIISKYIKLDDVTDENSQYEFMSEETCETIKNKWMEIVKQDDVFTGKRSIMSTPDGEVKVTNYKIRLDEKIIKEFLNYFIEVIYKDEKFKENFEAYLKQVSNEKVKMDFDKIYFNFKKMLDNSSIKEFNYDAFIDIDGYIVKESIEMKLELEKSMERVINSIKFSLQNKRWSIGKKQKFEFPEIKEKDIIPFEEIGKGILFMIEDIFKNE
ncbi:hypothetical protein [Caloranaerobacter azorensis]|uniref:Lipoprotein n=1 Tax=Caloranaerobacter azorensis TaxID=116090 RepID=A0A6P1YD91_9FIRM|nr:hypothetical protein [Caloranaerobacter azorensis]QIB27270.1 hypothetical protein G3A45_08205 [Caloranaerobacter azorensis]